jgi:hypothetical protein
MQNKIIINWHTAEPQNHNCNIELSPIADKTLGQVLREFAEIELMRGEITKLPNGNTRYEFNLEEEKVLILKEAIMSVAFYYNFSET